MTDNHCVTNKRNHSISLVRFVAMCMIVLCHYFQYFGLELAWWFNVGVQMFFFISGFLYGGKDIQFSADFIIKNFKKILLPYYCFLIPIIAIYILFERDFLTVSSVIRALLSCGTIKGIEHLWFVPYILFCYVITPYISAFAQKFKKLRPLFFICAAMLSLFLGQALSLLLDSFFLFSRIACYLLGFYFAVFREQYGVRRFQIVSWLLICAALFSNGIRIYFQYVAHTQFFAFDYFTQYSHLLLGAAIVLLLLAVFHNLQDHTLLRLSDRYSYHVYIVHQLFILSPFSLLGITRHVWLNCLVVLVMICCSAFVLKVYSDRVEAVATRAAKRFDIFVRSKTE